MNGVSFELHVISDEYLYYKKKDEEEEERPCPCREMRKPLEFVLKTFSNR
jgi:hypothetical protein